MKILTKSIFDESLMSEKFTFIYTPNENIDTCQSTFEFELDRSSGRSVISKLVIEGEKGCSGHPQTICVLLKGKALEDLPIKELSKIVCGRESSYPQELVKTLNKIPRE